MPRMAAMEPVSAPPLTAAVSRGLRGDACGVVGSGPSPPGRARSRPRRSTATRGARRPRGGRRRGAAGRMPPPRRRCRPASCGCRRGRAVPPGRPRRCGCRSRAPSAGHPRGACAKSNLLELTGLSHRGVPVSGWITRVDKFFKITERGSTVGREVRGGVVTFFTMAYIIVLNPLILGFAKDADGKFLGGGNVPNLPLIAAATALVAGVMTILMGMVANFPLALATGLGLNAFVAFSIASGMSWQDAMGLVVLEGLVILVLVLTGFRKAVFHAVPAQLKTAISVGIGLFVAFIGLVDSGFVRRIPDAANTTVPVQLGATGFLDGWPTLVFAVGLALMVTLFVRKVRGAILISIIATTVLAIIVEALAKVGPSVDGKKVNPTGWNLNVPALPDKIVDVPDFGLLGQFSLFGAFERVGVVTAVLFIFTLMLADFFDTM